MLPSPFVPSTERTTTNIGRRRANAKADGGPAYEARRQEIIKAAGRVFLSKGYVATSFKDIADELGLDRASLYYYFASKQELFQTATGAAVARNAEAAEQLADSDAEPAEKVARILAMVLHSYTTADYPYMYIFLQEDLGRVSSGKSDRWARDVNALSRRWEAAVTRIFAEGMEAGAFSTDVPPAILTKAIIGMTNWTSRWFRADGEFTAEQIAEFFSTTVLRGISR